MMEEQECGCVAVADEDFRVVGVLTDRDVCMAALRTDSPLSRLEVGGAMSINVFSCRPDASIAEAEQMMGQHQVRRLPVVDDQGHLQGILSLDDIAREALREEYLIAAPVSAEAVGRTLGQIGRPRLVQDVETQGGSLS
jgi:CBS-domain-containing membrane protein